MSSRRRRAAKLRQKAKKKAPPKSPKRPDEPSSPAAEDCEKRAIPDDDPYTRLTRRQIAFGHAWAEADPEDSMEAVARRAGYSEATAASGHVALLTRNPDVIRVRDLRLLELQKACRVTVEDQLLGLRELATDPKSPPTVKVAARKALLEWFSPVKGMHRDSGQKTTAPQVEDTGGAGRGNDGFSADARRGFRRDVLGIDEGEEL